MFTRRSRSARNAGRAALDGARRASSSAAAGRWASRSGRSCRAQSSRPSACYPRRTVRLVEIRLLEGPNVYRLEPAVKVEVAVGRRRTWYGAARPERRRARPARAPPSRPATGRTSVASLVAWTRRLRADHDEGRAGVVVHRSSDPGHWIVTFPWSGGGARRERSPRPRSRSPSATSRPSRTGSPDRRRRNGCSTRWSTRIDDRAADAAGLDPRRRAADPDRVDHRDERQEHGDPADHPHPPARRPARRDDDVGRRPRRRADGRGGRLDRAGRRARRSSPRATSTSRSSRRPAAGIVLRGRRATSRTTRASSPTSRPTTSTSRASTRCPSSPRSSRRSAG